MAFNFELTKELKNGGWKLKIREKETVEPPHVTVINGLNSWRWNLREKKFMDKKPPPKLVPENLIQYLKNKHADIVKVWDKKYPLNPVSSSNQSGEIV